MERKWICGKGDVSRRWLIHFFVYISQPPLCESTYSFEILILIFCIIYTYFKNPNKSYQKLYEKISKNYNNDTVSLNTNNLIKAIKIIEGTAKNMGIQIND